MGAAKTQPKAHGGGGKKISIDWWANVYRRGKGHAFVVYNSRKVANRVAGEGRVACVRVLIQGREGDGRKKPKGGAI